MKKISKILALVLCIAFIVSALCGCGKNEVVKTGGKFTYWVPMDTSVGRTHSSFNELLMYKEMEKRTGTEVEFLHPSAGSTGSEAFQVLLASGDYPDMIEYWWNEYPGGGDQAIEDGVIIALNDYMEDYAPNYYYYMEGEGGKENGYLYKASTISDAGNYYGFKNLNVGRYRGFTGIFVRKDMLDKWGLDIPTTIDEWELVFKTAKENGVKYPLTGTSVIAGNSGNNMFNSAWNVGNWFYVDGETVKYGPFEPEYKEYVKKMAEWVKEGYLDIDYVTNDNTIVNGYITNGTSIAANCYVSNISMLMDAMKEKNPEFNLAACPFPVMKDGQIPLFQSYQSPASEPTVVISAQCGIDNEDRYKEAISWCDYLYSEDGMILKSFGVEGDTFTRETDENGIEHFVYTDKITKNYEEYGAHDIGAALYHHFLPANHPGFNQHPDYFTGYYPYQQQKDAVEEWNKYVEEAEKYAFPSVTYSSEEAARKATIEANGSDNLTAAISNIILGKASIDAYDKAIKDAKKAGYDELIQINQEAYNRYISKIK